MDILYCNSLSDNLSSHLAILLVNTFLQSNGIVVIKQLI